MATLKSIKNKYLVPADGTVLGVTTNTENVSLLSFKLATADSLSKFNLVDGFSDDYNDATGVDASGSTGETRDSSGKYYAGSATLAVTSSGGQAVTTDGLYTIHKFTSSGNYITDVEQSDYEILLVGGGGAGGNYGGGGGGGAGGVLSSTAITVTAATHAVVVGTGGDGSVAYPRPAGAGDGANSTFAAGPATYTGYKGGRGAGQSTNGNGGPGYGSGGGGGQYSPDAGPGYAGGTGGNAGGTGVPAGGGGGGAGGAGANNSGSTSGNGGVGVANDILITGTDVYYGGGGGGSVHGSGTGGTGGNGGGANGQANTCSNAPNATDGTGGGGGGGAGLPASCGSRSGDGGNGIVIIRRPTVKTTYNNMTLASNAYTAQADPETIRIIMDEYTSIGSAAVNVDIKAYASRDNGTTYTQITTLADQGAIETNHRLLSGSVDVSGQPAGSSVKYKIETLNQSATKATRIYGASMAWA